MKETEAFRDYLENNDPLDINNKEMLKQLCSYVTFMTFEVEKNGFKNVDEDEIALLLDKCGDVLREMTKDV